MSKIIKTLQVIGRELAISWEDDSESYYNIDYLRSCSPSAETKGEKDLLGNSISSDQLGKEFKDISILSWKPVGSYAIQFEFSDGHNTGIYSFEYLQEIELKDNNITYDS